jgi:hypothetical protein
MAQAGRQAGFRTRLVVAECELYKRQQTATATTDTSGAVRKQQTACEPWCERSCGGSSTWLGPTLIPASRPIKRKGRQQNNTTNSSAQEGRQTRRQAGRQAGRLEEEVGCS